MVDFQIAQKMLLHPIHGNDKILNLNHILQIKDYHSFKVYFKNENKTD